MLSLNQKMRLLDQILKDDKFDSFILTARGKSMRPAIQPGTKLSFRKIPAGRSIGFGRIILIKAKNKFLIHRIIYIKSTPEGKIYLSKGDCRFMADGWWKQKQILAQQEITTILQVAANYLFAIISLSTLLIGAGLRRSGIRRG